MRLTAALVVVGMLQFTPAPSGPAVAGDWVLNLFESYLDALRRQAGIPGLTAVIVGEQDVAWERGFGFRDVEAGIPMTPDAAFHLDGLTQVVTAALALRCVEQGRLSLDAPIGLPDPLNPLPVPTLRQVLAHAAGDPVNPVYAHHPDRYEVLRGPIEACTGVPFREALTDLLEETVMQDSVPGLDAVFLPPPTAPEDAPEGTQDELNATHEAALLRYQQTLLRLVVPYAVDGRDRRSTPSLHPAATIAPTHGLISTARDFARLDAAFRNGLIVSPEMVAAAWQPPTAGLGFQTLPHGLGVFVQNYRGHQVVWQYGVSDGASSSLIISVPARGFSLILLANSDGLVRPFPLVNGDVTVSPFGRVFLGLFVP